jgi:hypothetical protein
VQLAAVRGNHSEAGVIKALRDVYDAYHAATGDSYIRCRTDPDVWLQLLEGK